MIMTNGFGATIGTLCAMAVVNHNVVASDSVEVQLNGWRVSWAIFAAYALVVALLFWVIFHDDRKGDGSASMKEIKEDTSVDGAGFIEEKGSLS